MTITLKWEFDIEQSRSCPFQLCLCNESTLTDDVLRRERIWIQSLELLVAVTEMIYAL